jgi:hypothetical protein
LDFQTLDNPAALTSTARTAFYFCFTVNILQARNKAPKVRYQEVAQILPNVLWDWHFLSSADPETFKFNGCGDLVWLPTIGTPSVWLRPKGYCSVPLSYECVVPVHAVFDSREYQALQLLATPAGDNDFDLSVPHIGRRERRARNIEDAEYDYWEQLVQLYGGGWEENELDALATCRSRRGSFASLATAVMHWRWSMTGWLDGIAVGDRRPEVFDRYWLAATAAERVSTLRLRMESVPEVIQLLRSRFVGEETLRGLVPVGPADDDETNRLLETLHQWCGSIVAVNRICKELHTSLKAGSIEDDTVVAALLQLSIALPRHRTKLAASEWLSDFMNLQPNRLAKRCLKIIDELFGAMSVGIDVSLNSTPSAFYGKLLGELYPLPREHFLEFF